MKGEEIVVDPEKIEWEDIKLSGTKVKYLHKDEHTGASVALVHFEKGFGMP